MPSNAARVIGAAYLAEASGEAQPGCASSAMTRSAVMAPGAGSRNVVDSEHLVFVHGCIEYVDTFGIPHFTRFRLQDSSDGSFFACREGNETDQPTHVIPQQGCSGAGSRRPVSVTPHGVILARVWAVKAR